MSWSSVSLSEKHMGLWASPWLGRAADVEGCIVPSCLHEIRLDHCLEAVNYDGKGRFNLFEALSAERCTVTRGCPSDILKS